MRTRITVDGQDFDVTAQIHEGKIWAHWQGRNICVSDLLEARSTASKSRQARKAKSGDLLAPMPGKISKIFIQAQESVKCGQALIVMEAMKMEYTLKAEVDGVIHSLNVKQGDLVPLGKVLLHLKGEAP